jgi:hypothetical protein
MSNIISRRAALRGSTVSAAAIAVSAVPAAAIVCHENGLAEAYLPLWESEFAKMLRVEAAKPGVGCTDEAFGAYLDACCEASDEVETIERAVVHLKAETLEDVGLQALVALSYMDKMRDYSADEDYAAELGANALRLLYSMVNAMRQLGYLKASPELLESKAPAWRSPWLTCQQAEDEHKRVCGPSPGRSPIDDDSPARTFFEKRVSAFRANSTGAA